LSHLKPLNSSEFLLYGTKGNYYNGTYIAKKFPGGVFYMGSIQSLLVIGAMAIFALVSLRFNTSVLENTGVQIEDKVYLTAFSLADDLLEEMKQKAFDERTVDFQAISAFQLSDNLGPDGGETWPNYNDIDDYNNYSRVVSSPFVEDYTISCTVAYCTQNGMPSFIKSFYKLVTITVSSKYLRSDFYMSFIFSLHSTNK
jgi:hypothetical protein